MTTEHVFGGNWTDKKLDCLRKYLAAYRQIFAKNPKAQFFQTWYVDAFAGTGTRAAQAAAPRATPTPLFADVYEEPEPAAYREGSARIALGLAPPFDHYLFIEKSKGRVNALQTMVGQDFPALQARCAVELGDANDVLQNWCAQQDWNRTRAVVFLDPYGMQVRWSTIEVLAATKGIDLWYLFPLGIGVTRLLKRDGNIGDEWKHALDDLFGTQEWAQRFYPPGGPDLFGDSTTERNASVTNIGGFIHDRLAQRFVGVAKGLVLKNSKASPMYLLCFAAGNRAGATTGCKIAQDILDD